MPKLKQNNSGFTIIEVVLVLAIVAVILLIVFLGVPALQRNSRNTNRKNDVGRLLAAVTEYNSNHPEVTIGGAISPENTAGRTVGDDGAAGALGYFNNNCAIGSATPCANITIDQKPAAEAATAAVTSADNVTIVVGGTCGAAGASSVGNGNVRNVVALWARETANAADPDEVCQQG